MMKIFKLNNCIQNYSWGSKTLMSDAFDIDNYNNEPQAELWMGAHVKACSRLDGLGELLSNYILRNKDNAIGLYTSNRYGSLPFLFKVLAVHMPLSIQVHPNLFNSKRGFEYENNLGISIDSPQRNYVDQNHKPELVYALTHFKAMNGFRPIIHIISLFEELEVHSLNIELQFLKNEPNEVGLKTFFRKILLLNESEKLLAIQSVLKSKYKPNLSLMALEVIAYCKTLSHYYDKDVGILAPLVLNIG